MRGTTSDIAPADQRSLANLWRWAFRRYGAAGRIAHYPRDHAKIASRRMFLLAFVLSCTLFWWLASFLYRAVLKLPDPVHDWALRLSFGSVLLFVLGYLLPNPSSPFRAVSRRTLEIMETFSYRVILILFAPVIAITILCVVKLGSSGYGSSTGIPFYAQAFFYPYLLFGLMYLGVVKTEPSKIRRIALVCALMILPRALITLHYGRFFAAEAIVPIAFLAIARGWIRPTKKSILAFTLVALAIIFVPSYTRGDKLSGNNAIVHLFTAGSTLQLFQDNIHLNLAGRCPPLLVSLTAKTIPYHELGICTIDYEGLRGMPATLERILTVNEIGSATETGVGTGSNYMLELFLTGGLPALIVGSILFGYICKLMVSSLANRSILSGIWAMCLSRALLAPRGNLGYVFELIPTYVLATFFAVALACMTHAIGMRHKSISREKT